MADTTPPGYLPAGTIWHPSPNHGPRRGDGRIDMVVIHYTAMADAASAIERLCDPASAVSAHYLIARDGALTAMVAEDRRAWHAGAAFWAGERDINSRSIGIELDSLGIDGDGAPVPFCERQMARLERLLAEIMMRHPVPPERVLGHACVAPTRKRDPGPAFDWRRLALQGLAVWHDPAPDAALDRADGDAESFRHAATSIGMDLDLAGGWDDAARAAWSALAARLLPASVGHGTAGTGAIRHLSEIARRYPGRGAAA
ncbi:MAG: N-acetylmuramoyl-L-alanine amidase [Pseudomonadota bacterium]